MPATAPGMITEPARTTTRAGCGNFSIHQEPVSRIVAAAVRQLTDWNLTSASFWNSQIFYYVIATRASIELGQRGAVSLHDSCCVAS